MYIVYPGLVSASHQYDRRLPLYLYLARNNSTWITPASILACCTACSSLSQLCLLHCQEGGLAQQYDRTWIILVSWYVVPHVAWSVNYACCIVLVCTWIGYADRYPHTSHDQRRSYSQLLLELVCLFHLKGQAASLLYFEGHLWCHIRIPRVTWRNVENVAKRPVFGCLLQSFPPRFKGYSL